MTLPNPISRNDADGWRALAKRHREEGYATGYAAGQADAADHLERLAAGCRGRAHQVLREAVVTLRQAAHAAGTVAPEGVTSDVVGRRSP